VQQHRNVAGFSGGDDCTPLDPFEGAITPYYENLVAKVSSLSLAEISISPALSCGVWSFFVGSIRSIFAYSSGGVFMSVGLPVRIQYKLLYTSFFLPSGAFLETETDGAPQSLQGHYGHPIVSLSCFSSSPKLPLYLLVCIEVNDSSSWEASDQC
jgi:hypothetical protein